MLHLGGVAQLAVLTGSLGRAAALGTLPFLLNDVVKVLLGALLSPRRASSIRD
jgi:biotin transporter BioY